MNDPAPSAPAPPNAFQEWRARMKEMNDWERLHPRQYTPDEAMRMMGELYDFAFTLNPRWREEHVEPEVHGMEKLTRIVSKIPWPKP